MLLRSSDCLSNIVFCVIKNKNIIDVKISKYIVCAFFAAFTLQVHAKDKIRVVCAGDIDLATFNAKDALKYENRDPFFSVVQNSIRHADASFASLDGSLSDAGEGGLKRSLRLYGGGGDVSSFLSDLGFSAFGLSGRHVRDNGMSGIKSTLNVLGENNISCAGIRNICEYTVFSRDGVVFGFASFGNAPHTLSMADSIKAGKVLKNLRSCCDVVVVGVSADNVHVAGNYLRRGDKRDASVRKKLKKAAHFYVDSGADIVYFHGEDLPQSMELYHDRIIMYGIGNYCAPFHYFEDAYYDYSPLVEVELYDDGSFCSGKILGIEHVATKGLVIERYRKMVEGIRRKTLMDFPDSKLNIDENGDIVLKEGSRVLGQIKQLVSVAKSRLGARYRAGASGPNSFDCSGFTSYIFSKIGISLKRSSRDQFTQGRSVDKRNIKVGDLVFFSGSVASKTIGHVGMVISVDHKNNDFRFIHASPKGGIRVDDFAAQPYYVRRYKGARRVFAD